MNNRNYPVDPVIEQYREVITNRRHYSSLRFALFPVFFALQYGVLQLAFKVDPNSQTLLPTYMYAISGVLISYVFWTIEERITQYYTHLENMGKELEVQLGFELIKKWPKAKWISNTKISIRFVYISFLLFWLFTFFKGMFA